LPLKEEIFPWLLDHLEILLGNERIYAQIDQNARRNILKDSFYKHLFSGLKW